MDVMYNIIKRLTSQLNTTGGAMLYPPAFITLFAKVYPLVARSLQFQMPCGDGHD